MIIAHHQTNSLGEVERSILKLFQKRRQLRSKEKLDFSNISSKGSEENVQKMNKKIQKYAQVVRQINESQKKQNLQAQDESYHQFWKLNEQKQKNVELILKQLKQNDENMHNICMRQQLIWKDYDQAQFIIENDTELQNQGILQTERQKKLQDLEVLDQQKRSLKNTKLSKINELLAELNGLKVLRQERILQFSDEKISSLSISSLNDLIRDLKQVVEQRELIQNKENEDSLRKSIGLLDIEIKQVEHQLLRLYELSNKRLEQLHKFSCSKQQQFNSQQNLVKKLQIQPSNLSKFLQSSANFINRQRKIKQQNDQLKQGVAITVETIHIFERVKTQIQSESQRKLLLMKSLASLGAKLKEKMASAAQMAEAREQITKLQADQTKLRNKLNLNAKDIDNNVRKLLNEQLQEYDADIAVKKAVFQKLRTELSQFFLQITKELNKAFIQFGDIIIDTTPEFQNQPFLASNLSTIQQLVKKINKTMKRIQLRK